MDTNVRRPYIAVALEMDAQSVIKIQGRRTNLQNQKAKIRRRRNPSPYAIYRFCGVEKRIIYAIMWVKKGAL